ncbi:MAG TPA: DUF5916 domain-containing protein [Pyrinomonadaceae bacterium]|jgi:hypothetical protein
MNKAILLGALLLLCCWSVCAQTAQPTASPSPDQPPNAQPPAQANSLAPAGASVNPVAKGGGVGGHVSLPPEKAGPVRIPRFEKPPVIDGKLDDAIWQQGALFKDFYETDPGYNVPAAHPTEVRMGYDAKTLYIAFRAYDEPGQVRATIPKRDEVLGADDSIRVLLDTYNDQRKAYVLCFSPVGVQQDGIRTEGSGVDFSVDIVMESKGTVLPDGYVVEVAIPFKSLRYAAGKDKLWGLQIFRQILHLNNESDSWMPLSRDISGVLNQAGHINGLEGIATERNLELIPSLTLSENGKRVRAFPLGFDPVTGQVVPDPGRMRNAPIGFDPGLTAKLGITPTITLDAAINPDFAQVEADAPVVLVNQRFPIFFQEKRPFFLEGKDAFLTPITAVHTRAIVDPDYAVKLTGKQGRNTFGLILASDNAPGNFSTDDRQSISSSYERCLNANPGNPAACGADPRRFFDKNAYIGVARIKRDFGKENTLGLIATTYNFIERHNDLGGLDGRFKLDPKTVFTFQALGTTSRRRLADPFTGQAGQHTLNGFGYNYNLDHSAKNWGYNLNGVGFTRGYRAEVGFTQRTDNNNHQLNVRWNTDPTTKGTIRQWRASLFSDMQHNFEGRSQRWDIQPFFGFNMARQTFITFGYRRAYERLFAREFNTRFAGTDDERSTYKWSAIVNAESQLTKQFYFFISAVRDMHVFDFDFGAEPKFSRASPSAVAARDARANGLCGGASQPPVCFGFLDPGSGNLWNIQMFLDYKPNSALHTTLNYTKQQLVRNDTHLVAFDDNIYSWRTTYQFTRFTYARVRFDYDTIPSQLRVNALVGWTPNPGTAFYVGYNDDLTRNGLSPFTGQLEPGFRRNGRQFFIKMSYLFRRSF